VNNNLTFAPSIDKPCSHFPTGLSVFQPCKSKTHHTYHQF
jgi:hypothetical protein